MSSRTEMLAPMKTGREGGNSNEKRSLRSICSEELSRHNKPEDLWISIDGKVYEVTEWLRVHPGGADPILSFAGQDITDAFLALHPASAWKLLSQFEIGILEDYQVSPVQADYRELLTALKRTGLFKNPLRFYAAYAAVIIPLFILCVVGVVCSNSLWVHVGCGALLGLVWIQTAYIGHDVAHAGMFQNRVDRYLKILVGNCATGIGMEWWRSSHNAHHCCCNSAEYDPDIQYMPFFAISSKFFDSVYSQYYNRKLEFDHAARLLVSYQHWTFYIVIAFARVNLYAQTFIVAFTKRMSIKTRLMELAGLAFFWLWFSCLLSRLPGSVHRIAFVLTAFAVTGIQHLQFVLNHFPSPVYIGPPEGKSWIESQVKGSLNIASSPWMDWFHGGLQFQIDHHLFPRFPRQNFRKLAPFVQALCEKHGLPYVSLGWWEANLRVLRTLRSAALEARDYSKPAPHLSQSLIWEAANARG